MMSKLHRGIDILLGNEAFLSVTLFDNDKSRVRLTKKVYGKKQKWEGEITISIGKPNYRERFFLRLCKKAKTQPREYWVSRLKRSK